MCGRGAAAAASANLTQAAEPKLSWVQVARRMAVEFMNNPKKYGDGSGSLRSWVVGDSNLHPSGFPESSLTQLRTACRAEEGPLLLQMVKDRKADEATLERLTTAVGEWTDHAARQAADDTAAAAQPAAERPSIACNLWAVGERL